MCPTQSTIAFEAATDWSSGKKTDQRKTKNSRCTCTGSVSFIGILFMIISSSAKTKPPEVVLPTNHTIIPKTGKTSSSTISSNSKLFEDIWCNARNSKNKCDIICDTGVLDSLQSELEREQQNCDGPLDVVIKNCDFSEYFIIGIDTFRGNYKMRSLTLNGCRLYQIRQGAFDQQSTEDMVKLKIVDSELKDLNNTVFSGLNALQSFQLINKEPYYGSVVLKNFLQPMANTLVEVSLLHQRKKLPLLDPTDWLGGANFNQLKRLNLSSNSFGDFITVATFANLKNITELFLTKCAITSIGRGTFDQIIHTLEYLDLSNNNLKLLDDNFLTHVTPHNFKIIIHNNPWNCTCENSKLIKFIQGSVEALLEEPVCKSPEKFRDVAMKQIIINCDEPTISTAKPTTITATITTTTPTTTTTTIPTSETIFNTTITTPKVPNTQSTEQTTTQLVPLEHLRCAYKQKESYISIYKPTANLQLFTLTPTSIHARIYDALTASNLVYLLKDPDIVHILPNEIPPSEIFDVDVNELRRFQSYLFCVVPIEVENISPFNCRSHYLEQSEGWLFEEDIAWFIGVNVLMAGLCLFVGAISLYFVLRCHPTIIKGSKRLVRCQKNPKAMLLLSKTCRSSICHQNIYGDFSGDKGSTQNCDYMQTYPDLKKQSIQPNDVQLPLECAPAIPKSCKNDSDSKQSTLPCESVYGCESNNEYNMFGIYEEIN